MHRILGIVITIAALLGAAAWLWLKEPDNPPAVRVQTKTEQQPQSARQIQVDAGLEGRWRKPTRPLTQVQSDEIQALEALGYVSGSSEGAGQTGVTRHNPEKAIDGVNFYTSGHGPEATLIDMDGAVLHTWRLPFDTAFPNRKIRKKARKYTHHWRRAVLLENGDVIAIFEGQGIIRVDRNSRLIWANPTRAHHDAHVMANGDIYTLTRLAHMRPRFNADNPILEDYIIVLDGSTGEEKQRVSVLEAFENSSYQSILNTSPKKKGDLLHTNAIEVLDGRLAGSHPAFTAGRILTSMRVLNALAVIDLESQQVVWATVGSFKRQHDPRSLDNGHILFFDNRGGPGPSSRILELDPATGQIEDVLVSTKQAPFYSEFCGTVIPMDKGNLLISETDQGRAFEIDPKGETVWEFFNPARGGDEDEFIAALFELERFERSFVNRWLKR
jgi:hypothetical protein